jgi:hypothetical protein
MWTFTRGYHRVPLNLLIIFPMNNWKDGCGAAVALLVGAESKGIQGPQIQGVFYAFHGKQTTCLCGFLPAKIYCRCLMFVFWEKLMFISCFYTSTPWFLIVFQLSCHQQQMDSMSNHEQSWFLHVFTNPKLYSWRFGGYFHHKWRVTLSNHETCMRVSNLLIVPTTSNNRFGFHRHSSETAIWISTHT